MAARDENTPSIREIAELTARLRRLSTAGRDADPGERAAFLADKDALIARIEAANRRAEADNSDLADAAGAAEPARESRNDDDTDDATNDPVDDEDGWSR